MPRGVALELIQNVVSFSLEYTARAALAKAGNHAGCTAFSQTRALYDGRSCGNREALLMLVGMPSNERVTRADPGPHKPTAGPPAPSAVCGRPAASSAAKSPITRVEAKKIRGPVVNSLVCRPGVSMKILNSVVLV